MLHKFSYMRLVLVATVFAFCLYWFVDSGTPLQVESPFRIVVGSIFLFLLPGLVWYDVFGFRSSRPFEVLANAFALTLCFQFVVLVAAVVFRCPVSYWLTALFGITFIGFVLQYRRRIAVYYRQQDLAFALILIFVTQGIYRWGESIEDVSGEKLMHMTLVRSYFSLPLQLDLMGFHQNEIPPNIVFFWEYVIAAWSTLINTDPLIVFSRARFVIPTLGLSSFYLLISAIFSRKSKVDSLFAGSLVLLLGWFCLLSPSSMDWIKEASGGFRGSLAFMGTAHHADSAMEILVPLLAAVTLITLRRPRIRNFLMLAGLFVVSFLWHPREFFQNAIYVGIFAVTVLFFRHVNKRALFLAWAKVLALMFCVAVGFFALSSSLSSKRTHSYDEFAIKRAALHHALTIENTLGFRNLFNFPLHMTMTSTLDPDTMVSLDKLQTHLYGQWQDYLWLILSSVSIAILSFIGRREDKEFALFFGLLWILYLSWNFGQLMFIVLTYSEINITSPRMLYIFAYILIADVFYVVPQVLRRRFQSRTATFIFLVASLILGALISWWWSADRPNVRPLSWALSVAVWFAVAWLCFRRASWDEKKTFWRQSPALVGLGLFFLPILQGEYRVIWQRLATPNRPSTEWFATPNPLGFSNNLTDFLKTLPPKKIFLTDPLGTSVISVYVPQFMAVAPSIISTMILDRAVYEEVKAGNHLFSPDRTPAVDDVKAWLILHEVNYILVEKAFRTKLLPFLAQFPESFKIVHDDPANSETVVEYLR